MVPLNYSESERGWGVKMNWSVKNQWKDMETRMMGIGSRKRQVHIFIDASSHLYKRVCPFVGPLVRPSRVFFNEPIMGENGRK